MTHYIKIEKMSHDMYQTYLSSKYVSTENAWSNSKGWKKPI